MNKKVNYFCLGLILLIGIFLRIYHLDQESLWTDEMVTLNHLRTENVQEAVSSITLAELMPPGYFLLMKYWTNWVGFSEFWLRIPSVVFDTISILIIYLLGKELFNRRVGLLSALLYATTMLNVVYAQEARPYSLFGLLALLSTYLLVLLYKHKINAGWHIYVVTTALALYVNYMTIFLLIIHGLGLILFKNYTLLKKYLFALVAVTILFIPGILLLLEQAFLRQAVLQESLVLRGVPLTLGQLGIGFYLIPITIIILVTLGVATLLQRKRLRGKKPYLELSSQGILALTALIIFMIGTVVILDTVMRSFALIRHSLFLLPMFYIFIAKGVLEIKPRKYLVSIIALILLFNVITLTIYFQETTKTPWRETIKLIEENSVGTPVILFDRTGSNLDLYQYYQEKSSQLIGLTWSTDDDQLIELSPQQTSEKLKSVKEFWLISSRNFKSKTDYKEMLEKNYHKEQEYFFKEMTVIKFRNNH